MGPVDPVTDPRRRRVRKRATPVSVVFADAPGTMPTLEGPVPYEKGDALLTGVKEERWPVARASFLERYEALPGTTPGGDGMYKRRPEVLWAVQVTSADLPLEITTASGGVLGASAGDWLIQYSPGDLGVVDGEIFAESYEVQP